MRKLVFPADPNNGDLFEAMQGLFYQYDSGTNSWIRIDGFDAIGLATPVSDGLMSPEDFKKLNDLIIPPPQISLKGEDCELVFSEGNVRLDSTDQSLSIEHSRNLINKIGDVTIKDTVPWKIHENTAGYDFRLNLDRLIEIIESDNRLTKVQIKGKKGPRGEKGDDGEDRVDTGPVGEAGTDGANAEFGGALTTDPISFDIPEELKGRAVVDIKTKTDGDQNYLIVTRANVGDPSACAEFLKPKLFDSPWILVVDDKEQSIVRLLTTSNDCAFPCRICNTSLHYLNIDPITNQIFQQFIVELFTLKSRKEKLFFAFLTAMVNTFTQQKAALCCALENCTTRKRNTEDRRFLETERIQAAQSDHRLVIDGEDDKVRIDTNIGRDCGQIEESCAILNVCDLPLHCTLDREIIEVPFGSRWDYQINAGGFTTGLAPFGSGSGPGRHPDNGRTGNSPFPIGSTLTLRRDLGTFVKSLTITYQVDDFADILVNGILIRDEPNSGDAGRMRSPITVVAPASVFSDGPNELLIIGRDSGVGFSWLDASLTYERDATDCDIPDDLPIVINPFLNRVEYDEGCGLQLKTGLEQFIRLSKTFGDQDSFEKVSPGNGIVLDSDLNKVYVAVRKGNENTTFRIILIDSEFKTYVWPFKSTSTIGEFEFLEFNASEFSTIDMFGGTIFDLPSGERPIISLIVEVDTGTIVSDEILTLASITLLESSGNSQVLAGFEWGGDSSSLNRAWNKECETTPFASVCGNGFLDLSLNPLFHYNPERSVIANLPKGEYTVEITDCCAQLARGIFSGVVEFEYQVLVDSGETEATRSSITNKGVFGSQALASVAYVGQKVVIDHGGGLVNFWVKDANNIAIDNAGSIGIRVRPNVCDEIISVTATEIGNVFVYFGEVAPENLIGSIDPVEGTKTSEQNYNLLGGSDPDGPNILEGPAVESDTTQIWFYNGIDGLSAFIINGTDGSLNTVNMAFRTTGNELEQGVRLSDSDGELVRTANLPGDIQYVGKWEYESDNDGGIIGPFDATSGAGWFFEVDADDLGSIATYKAISADGGSIDFASTTGGIGTSFAGNKIIFTPALDACQMSYKQIEWLERGHRTGASCSAVVELDGTKYIVVKRSIGTNMTCGGGESLVNQCVSSFISSGDGHPAIAWPTFNGEEFLGLPTSGFHTFVENKEMSDAILAKINNGEFAGRTNGDPAGQIPIIIFPTNI